MQSKRSLNAYILYEIKEPVNVRSRVTHIYVAKAFSGRPTKIQDEILNRGLRGTPVPKSIE